MSASVMNPERAAKIAAKRIGISPEEYTARRVGGEKWCCGCRAWHVFDAFNADRNRADGLASMCREKTAEYQRAYWHSQSCAVCGVSSVGQLCAGCHAKRAEARKAQQESLRPYKRLAWAVVLAARLQRRWMDAARRFFRGIGSLAARLKRDWDVAARRFFRGIGSLAARLIRTRCQEAERERRAADRERVRVERETSLVERRVERERRRATKAARWWSERPRQQQSPLSLDAPFVFDDWEGSSRHITVASATALDPAEEAHRESLWEIVGDADPAQLGEHELARLRERLLREGFAPPSVQTSERDRLRDPNRHAGESIAKSKGHGGGKRSRKAQQQVTRDHHVRELTGAQKKRHKQMRRERQAA